MSQISALKRITSNNTNVFNNQTINKYQDVSQHHNCNQIILNKDSIQVYIGRDIECNYRISSIEISRKHALIEYSVSDNYWNISDLNSTNGLFVNAVQLQSYSPYRLVNGDKVSFGPPNQSQFCYQFVDNYSCGGQQPLTQPSSQGSGSGVGVGTGSSGGGVGNGSGISYELSAIGLTTSLPTVIPIVTRIQTSTGSGGSVGGLTTSGYRHSSSLRLDIDANQSRTISLTANMPTTRSGINYSLSTTTTTTNTSRGTRSPRMSTGGGSGSHTSGSGWRCGTTFRTSGNPYVDHDYSNRGQHSSPAPKAVKMARLARIREAICRSPLTVAPMMARGESSATVAAKVVSEAERKRFDKELAKLERTKRSLEERSAGEMEKIRRRESHLKRQQQALDRKERETARREKELDKMRKELAKEKRRLREQQLQRDTSGDRRRQHVANNGGRDEPCDSSSQQTAVSSTSAKRKLRSDSAAAKRQCNTKQSKAADTETSGNDSDQTVTADSGVAAATSAGADTKEPMEEIFESEMTCPVCHEYFIHAVNLNCSHTFCFACIEEWKHSKAGAHVCPICRKRIENQNRELVLDNLIDRFVAKMKPELREHREKLVVERKKRLEKKASEAAAASAASSAAHGSRGRVRVDVGGLSQLRFFLSGGGGGASAEQDLDNYNVIGLDFGTPFITDGDSSSDSSVSSVSSSSDSSDDDNNSSDDDSDDDNNNNNDNNNNTDGPNNDRNNNSSDDDSSDDDNSDAEGGVITISAEDFAVHSDSDDNNSSDSDDGGDDSSTFDVDSDSDSSVQSVRSSVARVSGGAARASHSLASDQSSHYDDSDDGSSVAFESDFSDND